MNFLGLLITKLNYSYFNPNLPKVGSSKDPPLYKNDITGKVWIIKPKIL